MNIKGDKGECSNGIKGDKGDPGDSIKGDKGEPGKSIKGNKGDPGLGAPARTRKSAFTVIKKKAQTGNNKDVVTFDEAPSNIGNHFNLGTNKFTCQIPGTYVFMFTIGVYQNTEIWNSLVKNGVVILTAHSRSNYNHNFDQNTMTAILNLVQGDKVWVQFTYSNGKRVYSDGVKLTAFSGFLLYEA